MIKIRVHGNPAGQGAIRYSPSGHGYHADKRTRPWRDTIVGAVVEAWGGAAPWTGAVEVEATFMFAYLKAHYTTKGELKDTAPLYKVSSPDLDHLQRAVGDALQQSGAIVSDAQICSWTATKVYDQQPGCYLTIRRL